MEELFESCGLLSTFITTFLEGEVFFVAAVISSKLGAFSFTSALIAGFLGSYAKAWVKYYVAKKYGNKLLIKRPKLNAKVIKNAAWFDKNPAFYLIIHRLMFGLATVVVVLAGLRNMSYYKFAFYAGISSVIWVAVFGFASFYCAETVLGIFDIFSSNKIYFFATFVLIGLTVFYVKHRKHLKTCTELVLG